MKLTAKQARIIADKQHSFDNEMKRLESDIKVYSTLGDYTLVMVEVSDKAIKTLKKLGYQLTEPDWKNRVTIRWGIND